MAKPITVNSAREYFNLGVLTNFQILRDPMAHGWTLFIDGKSGSSWNLVTARGEMRTFKTLDAAASTIEEITGRLNSLTASI